MERDGDKVRWCGVNLDLHIHDIDAALWWWGRPDKATSHTAGAAGSVHSVLSQWEYRDGPAVQIEASWAAGIPFQAEFRITLESATLRCRGGKLELFTEDGKEEIELSGPGGHAAEMHYFIDCLLKDEPVTRCMPEDSALALSYALGQADRKELPAPPNTPGDPAQTPAESAAPS